MYSQPHVLHGRVSKTASSGSGYLMPDGSVINNARPPGFLVDASRFHPASIAGLMVGAMGLFVLTLALGHWLRERRADG